MVIPYSTQVGPLSLSITITYATSFCIDDASEIMNKKEEGFYSFMQGIVRKSLSENDYKQIGRLPKFFNTSEKKDIDKFNLVVWPGYTCQVKPLNDGLFFNADTCTKFLQRRTILQLITELKQLKLSNSDISKKLTPKWDNESTNDSVHKPFVVITAYNSATYQVEEILWDETPVTIEFEWKQRDP